LLNVIEAELPCAFDMNSERLTAVIVAFAGIAVRSKAISPRRKLGAAVRPAKK
jgi:hypothetical protein